MQPCDDAIDAEAIDRALARAVLYHSLAAALHAPKLQAADGEAMAAGEGVVEAAAATLDDNGGDELARLAAAVSTTQPSAAVRIREYAAIFGHTARGVVVPYETEYGPADVFQQTRELADIGGFLQAFGLRIDPAAHERVDHIACECELMELLTLREAWCLERGDHEQAQIAHQASRSFLRDHLGRFGRGFGDRLQRAVPDSWYGALGALIKRMVEMECARENLAIDTADLTLRPPEAADAPLVCGAAGCGAPGEDAPDGGLPCG